MMIWLKGKLVDLLHMVMSQRTVAAVVGWILIAALHLPADKAGEYSVIIAGLLIAAFTVRKPGEPGLAKMKAAPVSPSLVPPRFFPDPVTGQKQVIDPEDPRR